MVHSPAYDQPLVDMVYDLGLFPIDSKRNILILWNYQTSIVHIFIREVPIDSEI